MEAAGQQKSGGGLVLVCRAGGGRSGLGEGRCMGRFTLSLSMRLLSGPFHWMISFPRSRRKTSPRLKLFQDISTWRATGEAQTPSVIRHLFPIAFPPLALLRPLPFTPTGRGTGGHALRLWLMPTSPATTFLLPFTCSNRWTSLELVSTCFMPEATPPFRILRREVS